jgi:hypothetical protein
LTWTVIGLAKSQRTVQRCELPGCPEDHEVLAAFSVGCNCLMLLTATYRMSVSCLPSAPERPSNADAVRSVNEPYDCRSDAGSRRHIFFQSFAVPGLAVQVRQLRQLPKPDVSCWPISPTSAQHLVGLQS